MTTLERLREDMKTAMRSKDAVALTTVRMVLAELKNREIDKRAPLTEEETVDALSSIIKKRRDAIAEAEAAGRDDVAEREKSELAVIEQYMPAQLSTEELDGLIERAVAESGAASPGDMGKVMAALMPHVKGRADGKIVSARVRERLAGAAK